MISEDLAKSLVGMEEGPAEEKAKTVGEVVISRRDDEIFMTDMMMNDNRVKLEIEKGVVVKATVG